ncbi:hypothetical protein SCOR_05290 [Sulfidibacter corallicola]|uniref:Peptide zinc metalloprotease protein n=1 Tax=Sulfidibacter corallicola TaxID=2818388 RepID=A0A8A4TRW8_SULCO|nr:hypothetical protein [Sulfidibacter corallicola]QTD51812.1 hypothetical protein J3U87_05020 [Sulfidibacter corallicola]
MMEASRLEFDSDQPIDSAERKRSYLVKTPGGKYLKVTPSAYELLQLAQEHTDYGKIAGCLTTKSGEPVTAEWVEKAYNHLMEKIDRIEKKDSTIRKGFWIRQEILPASWVNLMSAPMTLAFSATAAWTSLALLVVTFFVSRSTWSTWTLDLSFANLAWGYVLLLVSLIMHEFGHASACLRYGAAPSGIGIGVYMVYPVFYSDVTSAWSLKRWQRGVVDLGGMYFQTVCGCLYLLLFSATGLQPFLIGAILIGSNLMFSLNPVFRFDGYWVISDFLGIPNLSQQKERVAKFVFDYLRGKPVEPLPWSRGLSIFMIAYSLVGYLFYALFFFVILPRHLDRILDYPTIAGDFFRKLFHPDQMPTQPEVMTFLGTSFGVFLAGFLLWRFGSAWVLKGWHALRSSKLFGAGRNRQGVPSGLSRESKK